MDETASIKEPIVSRTICKKCGHLHRIALRKTCGCCGVDIGNYEEAGGIIL